MNTKNEVFEYLIDQIRQQVSNNPYKQQCEDLAHEVLSLKNQLRDASAQIRELHKSLVTATGDVEAYKLARKGGHGPEQSGCRKDDTQECAHEWCFYDGGALMMCRIRGLKSPDRRKEDTQKCPHSFYYVITDGSAPFGTKVCKTCGEYF